MTVENEKSVYDEYRISKPLIRIISVLLIALVLRCIAWSNTAVIDPDATLYIHQAKAINYSQWKSLTGCGLTYLSVYPILIAAGYKVFHDWVFAARLISLIFGFSALIPLYLLLRQFFNYKISVITMLLFAVMPSFVGRSVDALRDPTYWFFLVSSIYFFCACINEDNLIFLLLSSASFLMASWARIESALFIAVSFFYLIYTRSFRKLFIFSVPFLFMLMIAALGAIFTGISLHKLHRGSELLLKFSEPVIHYQNLRNELKLSVSNQHDNILQFFLPEARTHIWLIALGTLLNRLLEAYFYPFFIIFLIGLGGIRSRLREDARLIYILVLAILSLLMLYGHIFDKWVMDYRFLAIFIFPSAIFTGFGIEKIISFLNTKFSMKESQAMMMLAFMIFICALPKNISPRDPDKSVFRQIGELIAKSEGNQRAILVSASADTQRWISFYANLHYKGASCPESSEDNSWEFFPKDTDGFIQNFKNKKIKYFLWTENRWPKTHNFFRMPYRRNLKELGRWYHSDTGRMILFEVI